MTANLVRAACVPLPLQIVLDDVGWWSGRDGHARQEPYRTGIEREHAVEDYEAIALLGERLGMRPQAAMVLCEWDRENILRRVPTSTWMGEAWDNRHRVGPWLDRAAAVLRDRADRIEPTLHGVGHEYWENGAFTRAEWYGPEGTMRPREQVLAHLDAYARIMRQNGLGDFPTSFVPAAFRYCYGDGEEGLAAILAEWGVTFISTPFASMRRRAEPQTPFMGVDQGIATVDRGILPRIPWYALAAEPADAPGPILGLHWPNILHPDPDRNGEVVDHWVDFLRGLGRRFDRLLAPDTAAFQTQLAHHLGAELRLGESELICDFSGLGSLAGALATDRLVLKIASTELLQFSSPDASLVAAARDEDTAHYALTLRIDRGRTTARIAFQRRES